MAVKTDKTQDVPGALTPPKGGPQPFDGQAKTLKVSKKVNAGQLIDEVYARLGDRSAYEVVLTGDEGQQVLHVLGEVDMRTVRGVVESHAPDADHGLSEDQVQARRLRERLVGGEDLSAGDLNTLMRAFLA